jgi:outer membrane protein assembly factor BamB
LASTLLACGALPAAPPAPPAEWPGWRGPSRDGKSGDTGLLKSWPKGGPALRWKHTKIGEGYSSMAVAGGRVYVTGIQDKKLVLRALDMNGKEQWKKTVDESFTLSSPGARSTPTVHRGRLYLISGNGVLVCLDAKTGKSHWRRHMTKELDGQVPVWGYTESVLVDGDLALVTPGGGNCVVALNRTTGKVVWRSPFIAGAHYGSPIAASVGGVRVIVAGTGDGLLGVDGRTGKTLWTNDFSAGNIANCPTPVWAEGHVFWATGYGKGGLCLKLAATAGGMTAKEVWRTEDMDCHHGGYVVHEGHVYGNDGQGWSCVDFKTGKRKWHAKGVGKGSLCWADGMLYLFSEVDGQAALATCSPKGLDIKGTVQVEGTGDSWAHPVVTGGRLYLRYDTNLYCFDVKAK